MKKGILLFFFFVLFIYSAHFVFSHEAEEEPVTRHPDIFPLTQLQALEYGSLVFSVMIVIALLFHKVMNDSAKKIMYFLIVTLVSSVTLYLVAATIYMNHISPTKGPVHWHADYEIWVCGKQINLEKPKGMSNMQGTELVHSHDDNRIHVEGTLIDKNDASLGSFFHAIGGSLYDDGISVPTDNGIIFVSDGGICNGKPGRFYVFVNGKLQANPSAYVISPFEKVPPGDRIKFVLE